MSNFEPFHDSIMFMRPPFTPECLRSEIILYYKALYCSINDPRWVEDSNLLLLHFLQRAQPWFKLIMGDLKRVYINGESEVLKDYFYLSDGANAIDVKSFLVANSQMGRCVYTPNGVEFMYDDVKELMDKIPDLDSLETNFFSLLKRLREKNVEGFKR